MSLVQNLFSQGTIERLGWMLVHFLWQATAVVLLLAVVLRLLRRADANLRYVVACLALGLIVVLPLVTVQLVKVPQPVAALPLIMPASGFLSSTPAIVEIVDEIPAFDGVPSLTADTTAPMPWQERLVARVEPALPYVVLGWLAGVFGLSAWHLGGWAQLQRLKRRMVREVEAALRQRLVELSERLGVRRAVRLLESAVVEVPTVVGWLRPVILLPASALTGLSTDQLEAILAHELAHIRRCDYLVNVLQTIVEILGFYHPAVWWVSHRIRVERENCCDDLAVHVCGSSLQYARALTSMEEIRHRRTDLALAAGGGSLVSRIARLLGRPAGDDRRFTWLPGLLALLVVIGLVIPAALALGVPDQASLDNAASETPSQNAAVSPDETENQIDSNEPPRTRILVSYTLAEVFADRMLDPETATQASGLLMPIPAGDARRIRVPTVPPDVAELQKPLRDALARFTPAPRKGKAFADLLLSRGYADVLAKQNVLLFEKEPAVVAVGEEQDPNAPESQALARERQFGSLRLSTRARLLDERDTVMVETKLVIRHPVDDASDPNERVTTTEIDSMSAIPDGQYSAFIERGTTEQNEESARQRLHILLVQPTIVHKPEPDTRSRDDAPVQVATDGRNKTAPSESPEANLLLNFTLVKAKTEKRLDHETVLQVENILGESMRTTKEGAGARQKSEITLGEILKSHVVGRPLPPETVRALNDLLVSKGYIEPLTSPQLHARNGQETKFFAGGEVPVPAVPATVADPSQATAFEFILLGTTIVVTAHIGDHNDATLKMAIELTDLVRGLKDGGLPLVRRTAIESTMTVPNDRYFSLLAEPAADQTTKTQEKESILVMVKPSVIPRRPVIESASDEPPKIRPVTATFTDANLLDALRVFSRQSGARIGVDMTVKPIPVPSGLTLTNAPLAVALQTVLQGTDYRFQTTDENTYLVFKPITHWSKDDDLRRVLEEFSMAIGVPILSDPNITGTVYADVRELPLEKALEIILAGTPYMIEKMPDHILIVDRSAKSPRGPSANDETQRIRLKFVTLERVKSLLAPAFKPYIKVEPTENTDPDYGGHILTVTAPADLMDQIVANIRRIDVRPRQVLLNVLMVRMESGDLTKLGIEWARPTLRAVTSGSTDNTGGRLSGVQIGYAPDRTATDSFLAAVNLLQEKGRAKIVANPQLVAVDGRESSLRAMMEKWLSLRPATNTGVSDAQAELHKVDYGTALSVTPSIGDSNEITLTMAVELSESLPRGQGQDLPVVRRRIARNAVTIRDGGTVAVAGLTEHYAGQNGTSTGETVIFVTAQVLPTSTSSKAETPAATRTTLRPPAPPEKVASLPRATGHRAGAGTRRANSHPRPVLLDARIVTIQRGELQNLGIEWASPTLRAGASSDAASGNAGDDANDIATRIQAGCIPDRAGTDMLLAALDRLREDGCANILANRTVLAQDGREAQMRSVMNELFFTTAASPEEKLRETDAGTVLSITPYVGDANTITLESVVETSDSIPQEDDNPPVVVRRAARNVVTIQDGGTMALTGLRRDRHKGERVPGLADVPLIGSLFRSHDVNAPPKEIAIFVTAHFIPDAR